MLRGGGEEDIVDKVDIEVIGMGTASGKYPGEFTPTIRRLIESLIYGKVLHLYSGSSLIGDERIDIEHPNATINCRVEDFIRSDTRHWEWVILDPPYSITRVGAKLRGYGLTSSPSADVKLRRLIKEYFRAHIDNILWLDGCAPMVADFKRVKLWLVLPGGFHSVRVLSWLQRVTRRLV